MSSQNLNELNIKVFADGADLDSIKKEADKIEKEFNKKYKNYLDSKE